MLERWSTAPFKGEADFIRGVLERDPDAVRELYIRLSMPAPEITWTATELIPKFTYPLVT